MNPRIRILLVLSLCGLALNLLLLSRTVLEPVTGCGGGGCDEVLASRWSQVLGVPISIPGIAVYLVLLGALRLKKRGLVAFFLAAIAGSAVWLVFVQAVLLRQFCPWCMATHGVGVGIVVLGLASHRWSVSFRRGLQAGLAAAFCLALAQLYGPVPATHRIEQIPESTRQVTFDKGRKTFEVTTLPRLGRLDAKHVIVEYFDYQCPACRKMGGYLTALLEKHPADICVLLLPVPLDRGCNPLLQASEKDHPGSCALTEIALAVWRVNPEAFPAIHQAFLSDPPPDQTVALALAAKQIPPAQLAAALRDPWIDRLILSNIDDWISYSQKTKQLPKLLIRDQRILHGLPPAEDFIRVIESELGL